tara:strand:+ start:1629 stop:4016 length:2388 start_codon:yes stop_codon:yes gene_type:complete
MAGVIKNTFPSQVVSDVEKLTGEYGLEVGEAIENEWFNESHGHFGSNRYTNNINNFHTLRLYARGEQSIQKYKDELSINGDLSYLNLDWKPVPIIPKFVDIVVNGIAERMYSVKAYSQDNYGVSKRNSYMQSILKDMHTRNLDKLVEKELGVKLGTAPISELPRSKEELDLHMQITYKQGVEIAEEQAINMLLEGNKYELIRKRLYYDLATIGIAAAKTEFNTSQGVKVEYVDPAKLVYSYTDSPYFDDIYYVGEVKTIPVNELKKQFPHLTNEDLKEITEGKSTRTRYLNTVPLADEDNNKVQVLYFNYKTYMNNVYKVKETGTGGEKAIKKDDSFNPPKDKQSNFSKLNNVYEVLFEGVKIVGTKHLLKWEMAKNMMRPKSDYTKVKMNYHIVAPRLYNNKIESLVGRITGFADMIQLTHLKLQQVMSRMVPDGIYLDADGLAEIDLGNGTNYNPQEALNMFFQTGSIIGRSFTGDGDMNPGKIPIQEIASGDGGGKMQSLIGTYNYYLQMIRDVTGLNEASDGSMPEKYSLVGVQKLAAANSNTATRHILQAGMHLTQEIAEALSLRISDIIEYSPTRDAFIQSLGAHNVATLEEMSALHLYDFGIFIELSPDEEEKAMLENNIQAALAQQSIELEDAIDIREVKNLKLANQLLKVRRKRKQEQDQQQQMMLQQSQAEANIKQQEAAAQIEMQKKQTDFQVQAELEQLKSQLDSQKLMQESQVKQQLLQLEYQLKMQLEKAGGNKGANDVQREIFKENRKDQRTKIQATQQSKMIEQRDQNLPAQDFEKQEI